MKGILWVDTEVNGKNVRTEYMQKYISYEIKIEHPFLLIPVKIKEETERLSFYLEDQKVLEYQVFPLEEGEIVDYYAPVPAASWIGRTIRLEGNYPEAFYSKMKQADRLPQSEQLHPLMHFSPVNGWMNDPNGLVCQDGIYHLFYQHNAFGTKWDNMSWGHAVSEDLLHWEHRSMAILPDEDGTIFSGSGLCNEKGLLELPENALVFFYTSAGGSSDSPWSEGRQFTQRIAYSTDRGETLHKKNQVIVPNLTRGNRDPKVYWHEESKGYIMSLYLKDHEYAILRSEDLEHWKLTQRIFLLTTRECPDLRPVPVEGGQEKWMLFTALGEYFTGDFDGFQFTNLDEGRMAYQNELPYAGQTYFDLKDRVVLMHWLRTKNPKKYYTGMMGIPRELTFIKGEEGFILRQSVIREWKEQRILVRDEKLQKQWEDESVRNAALELYLKVQGAFLLSVNIYGQKLSYQRREGILWVNGVSCKVKEDLRDLSIIVDREILEVAANEDTLLYFFETDLQELAGKISVEADQKVDSCLWKMQ